MLRFRALETKLFFLMCTDIAFLAKFDFHYFARKLSNKYVINCWWSINGNTKYFSKTFWLFVFYYCCIPFLIFLLSKTIRILGSKFWWKEGKKNVNIYSLYCTTDIDIMWSWTITSMSFFNFLFKRLWFITSRSKGSGATERLSKVLALT